MAPPESPDLNTIENLWHELKEYIRGVKKPRVKEELISRIEEFWQRVSVENVENTLNIQKKSSHTL